MPQVAAGDDDKLRAQLAADPQRPQFHLLPAKNWMNDPNGPIFWKGKYHMFFQYNPNAALWGDMHWAHAVSGDMIHWQHLPIALSPTPGWEDADGCFTGSAVDDRGTATVLYTGVKTSTPDRATLRDGAHNFREVQCLATSSDPDLRTWTKWRTPVLEPPQDPRLTGFRDPFLWRGLDPADIGPSGVAPLQDGDKPQDDRLWWYLGVGSGLRKQGGLVLLYRSKNLRLWEYLHPLASGKWTEQESVNPVDSGEMWECPDFFELGSKHVLLYSTAGKVIWEVGELDPKELAFHTERQGILDHGAYYAQKTQLDLHGNRILWGWIPETRREAEFSAAGWAGCMALPRVLSIGAEGDLEMRFAPEVQSLRGKAFNSPGFSTPERVSAAHKFEIKDVSGEFLWQSAAPGSTFILADRAGTWFVASMDVEKLTINGKTIALPPAQKPVREFHLILDASVAELICDNQHAITTRIYRKPDGPLRVSPESSLAHYFYSLSMWQLAAISRDRLTTS